MNGSDEPKPDYADEHESGQFRLAVPGEQVSLLPLPDSLIPCLRDAETLDNPAEWGDNVHHDAQRTAPQSDSLGF